MIREAPRGQEAPVLGSLPYLMREGMVSYIERNWRARGDVFRARIGSAECLVTVHPDAARDVLKTKRANYVKGQAYDNFRLLVGNGLVTSEGDEWQRNRRIAQPVFVPRNLESFLPVMDRAATRMLARWRARPDRAAPFDVHAEMTQVTLEIVAESLFGTQTGADEVHGGAFADALHFLSARGLQPIPIPLWIPTPTNRGVRSALARLDDVVYRVIREARSRAPSGARSFLSLLVSARDEITGQGFDDPQLRDEVITMFLAGHETTALTLTWGLLLLADHPDVVARIREEADAVLGSGPLTQAELDRLPYTSMVLDEILRLRSPVWSVARNAAADDEILGYRVRKGDTLFLPQLLVHRHPEFWDEPESFRPERFAPGASAGRHPYAYFPFSAGPRVCIGNVFSLLESRLLLARILREVTFTAVPGPEIVPVTEISMRPSGPVILRPAFLRGG